MAKRKTEGKSLLSVEIADEVNAALRDYVEANPKRRFGEVVELAIRRHLAWPPPEPEVPPLPDSPRFKAGSESTKKKGK